MLWIVHKYESLINTIKFIELQHSLYNMDQITGLELEQINRVRRGLKDALILEGRTDRVN